MRDNMGPRGRRPGRGRRGDARPTHGRRPPPPEATGLEDRYLKGLQSSNAPIVIQLTDGGSVRGVVESFDRDLLTLTCGDGPGVTVRKSNIRYLGEDS